MISVIMPTLNNGATLAPALAALIPAAVQGIVREVIIVDAGSNDQTLKIADGCGAITLEHASSPHNHCLAAAQSAKFPWVLLLSPQVVLDVGWEREVDQFIHRVETQKITAQAAVFPLVFDAPDWTVRHAERLIRVFAALSGQPHHHQGLLIQRAQFIDVTSTTRPIGVFGAPASMPRCQTLRASASLDTSVFANRGPFGWALTQFGAHRATGWFSSPEQRVLPTSARQQPAIT
jgi:Glycosyl transferase family 2